MQSLGIAHFKVIDNILREEEEALAAATASREGTRELSQLPPKATDDDVIDAVLRADTMHGAGSSTATQTPDRDSSKSSTLDLSPASRRRIYKRLYMRRKRGQATGTSDALLSETHAPQRIKPGRKSRPRKKRKTDEGSVVIDGDDDEYDDDDDDDPRHNIGGKTRHYKIKGQFEAVDFDAKALQDNGLELFHLSALAKLMRCAVFDNYSITL